MTAGFLVSRSNSLPEGDEILIPMTTQSTAEAMGDVLHFVEHQDQLVNLPAIENRLHVGRKPGARISGGVVTGQGGVSLGLTLQGVSTAEGDVFEYLPPSSGMDAGVLTVKILDQDRMLGQASLHRK